MTKPKPNPQPKLSYCYLLEDPDVKRWHDNVARGSLATAAVWLRRVGFIHKNFRKTPQDVAKRQVTVLTLVDKGLGRWGVFDAAS